jgi:hypothetical protein
MVRCFAVVRRVVTGSGHSLIELEVHVDVRVLVQLVADEHVTTWAGA